MSAREELISLLRTTMDTKDAEAVVDAFVHELAECLRGFGMEDAGDFIDPASDGD